MWVVFSTMVYVLLMSSLLFGRWPSIAGPAGLLGCCSLGWCFCCLAAGWSYLAAVLLPLWFAARVGLSLLGCFLLLVWAAGLFLLCFDCVAALSLLLLLGLFCRLVGLPLLVVACLLQRGWLAAAGCCVVRVVAVLGPPCWFFYMMFVGWLLLPLCAAAPLSLVLQLLAGHPSRARLSAGVAGFYFSFRSLGLLGC